MGECYEDDDRQEMGFDITVRTADSPLSVSIGACDNSIEIASSTTASTAAFIVASVGPTT